MNVKTAGKKGGTQKGVNFKNERLELATRLSQLVNHKSELVEMLAQRTNSWLRAKVAEYEDAKIQH